MAVTMAAAIDTKSVITKSSKGFRGVTTPTTAIYYFISIYSLYIVFFHCKTIIEFAMAGVVSTVSM